MLLLMIVKPYFATYGLYKNGVILIVDSLKLKMKSHVRIR
jgi:hypothetical protein